MQPLWFFFNFDGRIGRLSYWSGSILLTVLTFGFIGLLMSFASHAAVPEDRKAFGLVLNQSVRFNVALPNLLQFTRNGLLRSRVEDSAVRKVITDVQIKPDIPNMPAENLSGGNQQKVVVGKWLLANPRLVIFDEPTRGIDVGAKAEIYLRIRELTRRGVSVIMASSELPELIGMCDRIVVFHEGRIVGELERAAFSEEAIMRLATAADQEMASVS